MRGAGLLVALSLGMAGCGGDGPSVSRVVVTVRQAGVALASVPVVKSADIDSTQRPPIPTGVLETLSTDSSGQVTFTVPASTVTGQLCFSSHVPLTSGYSFAKDCRTLNALTATVALDHL